MSRRALEDCRHCERFDIDHNGTHYVVTIGTYPDGSIGEVFLAGGKSGTDVEAAARDCAVACSLALQFGCPLEVLQKAMTRLDDKTPAGAMCRVFDILLSDPTWPK